jgi:hypothetical protein
MNRRVFIRLGILIVVLSLGFSASPVMAAQPLDVHIEAPTTIDTTDVDTFTATGPFVDAGGLCPSGDVSEVFVATSGPPGGTFRNLRIVKHFVCDNGSGTFDVKLNVRLDLTTSYTTASWKVVEGTGAYTRLKGNGKLIGIPDVPNTSILDIYDGQMH